MASLAALTLPSNLQLLWYGSTVNSARALQSLLGAGVVVRAVAPSVDDATQLSRILYGDKSSVL